jgi:hypothetical protein
LPIAISSSSSEKLEAGELWTRDEPKNKKNM